MRKIYILVFIFFLFSSASADAQEKALVPKIPGQNTSKDFDLYKKYRFLIKIDGRYVAGANSVGGLNDVSGSSKNDCLAYPQISGAQQI